MSNETLGLPPEGNFCDKFHAEFFQNTEKQKKKKLSVFKTYIISVCRRRQVPQKICDQTFDLQGIDCKLRI